MMHDEDRKHMYGRLVSIALVSVFGISVASLGLQPVTEPTPTTAVSKPTAAVSEPITESTEPLSDDLTMRLMRQVCGNRSFKFKHGQVPGGLSYEEEFGLACIHTVLTECQKPETQCLKVRNMNCNQLSGDKGYCR